MDFRKSLSSPFKKLKHRLGKGSRKRDGKSEHKNDQEGGETDVEGSEASQRNSYMDSELGAVAKGGPNQERSSGDVEGKKVDRVDPSKSSPLFNNSVGNPTIHAREVAHPNESEPGARDENKLGRWKSTASATAKLLLRGVNESADAFGPLKSVAGGLCFILENCERTNANNQAIESLAPKIEALSASLCAPTSQGDENERARREELGRKLGNILQELKPLAEQGKVEGFFNNVKNADKLGGLVGDIHDAMIHYQTSLQQDLYDKSCQLIGDMDRVLLNGMHHTSGASHRSGNRQGCLRGTREDVFLQLERWLRDEQDQRVFWLNGLAGTGKSTIAQTFAESCFADGNLGASFFCSRDFDDRSNLEAIFPTLAFQLAYRYPQFREELVKLLRTNPDIGRESLSLQIEKLIVSPFKATQIQTLLIIDALDECKDENPESAILFVLSKHVDQIPNVKLLITGRPDAQIRSGFRLQSLQPVTKEFKLHKVERPLVDNDIKLFFRTQLSNIPQNRSDCDFPEDWPTPSDVETLCEKAAGFFIYASTVIKFITSKNQMPTEQLEQIISLPQSTAHEGRSGIDLLYTQVLEQAVSGLGVGDREIHSHFKTVVGTVLLAFNPLSLRALSDLLRVPGISATLHSLHSLLLVPTNKDTPIQIFHKSFPDFITDPQRCTDLQFFIDPSIYHREIVFSCLNLMKDRLKKNICGLDDFAVLSEVQDLPAHRKTHIGDALEYACCFWTSHLARVPGTGPGVEELQEAIQKFFTTHLLFWIEALSLMGKLDIGVHALNNVQQWYMLTGVSCKWTNDSQRFLLENFDTIYTSPSQIYHFALPFCPSSSWLRDCYAAEYPQEIKVVKGLQAEWGACSRTVLFDNSPQALAYWKDLIAVGLSSGAITILDAITGVQISILLKHSDWVRSLTYSLDGVLLVSGGDDSTINLWDVQTGEVVKTFYGHTYYVLCVSISQDQTTIASGSGDTTIRLWDIQTGECCHVIAQQDYVSYIRLSPTDPQCFISLSSGEIQKWNTMGQRIGPAYDGSHVAFSSDGTQFALCKGTAITVQNTDSGAVVAEFHVANRTLSHCCFSPDGRHMACAAGSTIYIWNITRSDPHPVETFVGHTSSISCLIFPSSLISASEDWSVKFWQIGTASTIPAITDTMDIPLTSAQIMSVTLQVRDGLVISGDSAGVVKTWDIMTGFCKALFQTPAKRHDYMCAQLIEGRIIVVWRADQRTYIWDAEKDKSQMLDMPKFVTNGLRISGDGSKVFILTTNSIQAWSIWTGEAVGEVELKGNPYLDPLYMDGSRIWIHFQDLSTQGWDFGISGSSPVPLSNISLDRPHLDFINGIKCRNGPARIKDTITGKEVFQLCGSYTEPTSVHWDGQYLAAGYRSGEVIILDFNGMLNRSV